MKNGKLVMLSLVLGLYSNSFSEETKGTVFLETNYIKVKEKKPKVKNRNFQPQQHFVNIWKNKNPIYDMKEYNEVGTINVDKDSIGLLATGNGVKISNNGIIQIDNGGIGMTTINSAQMENGINGQINLNGNSSVGILSSSGILGINNGKINLSGGDNFTQVGMASIDGGNSINKGDITVSNDNSYGMVAKNGSITNDKNIVIKDGFSGIGMEVQLDSDKGTNNGNVTIENTNNARGMVSAKGGESINNGEIILKNSKNSYGMNIGDGASLSNKETTIINNGNITLDKDGKNNVAIRVFEEQGHTITNGLGINKKNINVSGSDSYGMYGKGENVTLKNEGTIKLNKDFNPNNNNGVVENHNIGIYITGNANAENNGVIEITEGSKYSFGMVSFSGKNLLNKGSISINSNEKERNIGMQGVGAEVKNLGNIFINGNHGVGMTSANGSLGEKGEAINEGIITIAKNVKDGRGMISVTGSNITNNKIIKLLGTGYGMSNELDKHSDVEIRNNGMISLESTSALSGDTIGINGTNKTKIFNNGTISMTGDNLIGIQAKNNSNVITGEKSEIIIKGNTSRGIIGYSGSNIENKGKINITGDNNIGIIVSDNVKINNTGEININGNDNNGINIDYNSILINKGNINIDGSKNTGIYAGKNSNKVINEGTITIKGNDNTGIAIENGSSLKNTGQIIIEGQTYNGSVTTSIDSNGNKAIVNYGEILNEGTIVSNGEFNTNSMGTGKFTMEKDSTLEAKKIKGDIYLSSGITTGSLKNTYETNKMFDTEDMKANLLSSSLLFNSKLVNNNGTQYGAILERRNFNEVISDSSLANYLENNYVDTNNPLKVSLYDKYKNVSNQREMNNLVDDTFGKTLFPALEKQNFEIIRLNNNILKNNVSKLSLKDDFKYIVGGAYNRIDTDSTEKVQGYNLSLKNIWLGGEKRIDDYKKVGIVFSFGEHHSNFTDNSHREDKTFDGTIFANYNKDNLNMRTFATLGKMNTDLRREAKSFNTNFDSKLKNKYFVLSNEISQKFNFEKGIYVTPKASLNFYKLSQDKLEEKNNKYGLEIDKAKSFIIESGIGLSVGKDTILPNEYTLNTELEVSYFNRHRDTNDLEGRLSSISNDTFELENYKLDRNIGSGKLKISLEKDEWNVYTSYEARFEKDLNSIATLGIIYRF